MPDALMPPVPSADALVFQPVSAILALFRARELSPVEYLQALLDHIQHHGPRINALPEQYAREARAAARRSELRYAPGGAPGPLDGIPFSVKCSLPVEGKSCTSGSLTRRHVVSTESEPCVDRLAAAGAVLHARTASPEFCWAWTCESRLYGLTLNPWNEAVTCGGSCGGAAAALASGLTPLSLGSDSAGSIRMPSAMCGVVGYKPPAGRNPVGLAYCDDLYNAVGPMARTVDDCRLMQNVLNGMDPRDPNTLYPPFILDVPDRSLRGMRIAYSMDMGFFRLSADVRANTQQVLKFLESQGAIVEPVPIDWAREAYDKADAYGDFIAQDIFRSALALHPDELCDYTHHFAKLSLGTTLADHLASFHGTFAAWRKFATLMERFDCFICPTVATTDVPAGWRPWDGMVIDGQAVTRWALTQLFNAFRYCPALSVPSGLARNGVPTGIQVVGKPLDDATVFKVGHAVDMHHGFFARRQRAGANEVHEVHEVPSHA